MYNAHFGFREAPFGVTPDPQFYYSNAVYQEAWATLRYGIEARKGFILITGEAGTGKTTLLRKAMSAFGPNIKTAYIPNTLVGYADLLCLMLTDLGLPGSTDNKSVLIERLTDYLIEESKAGNIVALLIDEAQHLCLETLEELRLLGNLETDKNKLLQIVLVGQPELEQTLDQPELRQLKQRVALRCRLKPVARDDVESYMDSRLQTMGHRSEDLFDRGAVEKVAIYSTGIPRLINIICDNALMKLSKFKVSSAIVDQVAEDLCLGDSRMLQFVRAEAVTSRSEEKNTSECTPATEDDLTTEERPLSINSGDRPMGMHEDCVPSYRDTHRWFRPIVSSSAGIVLLTGLGVLLYSYEWGRPMRGAYSDTAAAVDSGRKDISQVKWAAPALEAPMSARGVSQAKVAGPQIQALTISDQNVSSRSRQLGKAIAGSAAEENVQQVATAVIVPEVQEAGGPPRGDEGKASTNSGDFLVVGPSFVRDEPTSSAAIIATLEPGTRITVADRTGDYYRIRSLGTETIRGYVHKEDAFFQPKSERKN
jgi:general secretion pathway protein A